MKIRETAACLIWLSVCMTAGCSDIAKNTELANEKIVAERPATLKTDAEAICRESVSLDATGMRKKYEATIMEISGTVTTIEEDKWWVAVDLAGPCPKDYRVECLFSENQRALARQIKQNQHVTFKGNAMPMSTAFTLHGCLLVQ